MFVHHLPRFKLHRVNIVLRVSGPSLDRSYQFVFHCFTPAEERDQVLVLCIQGVLYETHSIFFLFP